LKEKARTIPSITGEWIGGEDEEEFVEEPDEL
jgi:hypothetical protein